MAVVRNPDTGLYYDNTRPLIKIVVLGCSSVGKTSLLSVFVENQFTDAYKATIGADYYCKNIQLDDNCPIQCQLWGQERFQSLGTAFYRGAHGCALVFDLTEPRSFEMLSRWHEDFLLQSSPPNPETFPFVVIGNKLDRAENRCVLRQQAEIWCRNNGSIPYFETSAKDNNLVSIAFTTLIQNAHRAAPLVSNNEPGMMISLEDKKPEPYISKTSEDLFGCGC